jgi:hypothetical protein
MSGAWTGSGSCPMVGFGTSSVDSSGSAVRDLVYFTIFAESDSRNFLLYVSGLATYATGLLI